MGLLMSENYLWKTKLFNKNVIAYICLQMFLIDVKKYNIII